MTPRSTNSNERPALKPLSPELNHRVSEQSEFSEEEKSTSSFPLERLLKQLAAHELCHLVLKRVAKRADHLLHFTRMREKKIVRYFIFVMFWIFFTVAVFLPIFEKMYISIRHWDLFHRICEEKEIITLRLFIYPSNFARRCAYCQFGLLWLISQGNKKKQNGKLFFAITKNPNYDCWIFQRNLLICARSKTSYI